MKRDYYTKVKMSQIILDLIYLYQEMKNDGNTDNESLNKLQEIINIMKYYYQFLK